jgi:hypothetical protein
MKARRKKQLYVVGMLVLGVLFIRFVLYITRPIYADFHGMRDIVFQPAIGKAVLYRFDTKSFQRFLKKPSIEAAGNNCYGFIVYNKTADGMRHIILDGFMREQRIQWRSSSGTQRIAKRPIDVEFIDFMNDPDNIRQILLDRGIDDEIQSYAILEHLLPTLERRRAMGMCIWIVTEAGDYILHYKLRPGSLFDEDFGIEYRLYSLEEFRKLYSSGLP